jgi:hypothetical protein
MKLCIEVVLVRSCISISERAFSTILIGQFMTLGSFNHIWLNTDTMMKTIPIVQLA